MQFTFIISLVFAIFIAIFAVMNSGVVAINLFFSKFETSLAIVILGSAALGAIIIYLVGTINKFKSSRKIKELEKKVLKLEGELAQADKKFVETSNNLVSAEEEKVEKANDASGEKI